MDMRHYIRDKTKGGTYFITFTLRDRQSTLLTKHIGEFRQAFRLTTHYHDLTLNAMVLLPVHIHMVITLPENDDNYSVIIASLKSQFSRQIKKTELISSSRRNKRKRGIWQRRFWEHRIRDTLDYNNHIDYIHFNPVKHGYVNNPRDWPYSTLHQFITNGMYPYDWAESEISTMIKVVYD